LEHSFTHLSDTLPLLFASAQKFNGSCNTSRGGQAQASDDRFHLQIEKE